MAICFARGTRILTAGGEIKVEALQVGDIAITVSGAARPIRWIGRQVYESADEEAWPIRIARGAISTNLPSRDLYVSGAHSLFFERCLIHARVLENGSSVRRQRVDRIEYWHVELDTHDILLAEGVAAESYLDCGNRSGFTTSKGNATTDMSAIRPVLWNVEAACAPLHMVGPVVKKIRSALGQRAELLGVQTCDDPDVQLIADGKVLSPTSCRDEVLEFNVPATARTLYLSSRDCVPRLLFNSIDNRLLGIAVKFLEIDGEDHLQRETLRNGWHDVEHDSDQHWRWMNGKGELPLGRRVSLKIFQLPHYVLPWTFPTTGDRL